MSRSRNGATAPGGHERIGQRHEARIVHEAAEEAKLCHPEARIEQRGLKLADIHLVQPRAWRAARPALRVRDGVDVGQAGAGHLTVYLRGPAEVPPCRRTPPPRTIRGPRARRPVYA